MPKFLYFDLGNVLINFSVERMLRKIGAVAGVSPERAREVIFDEGLMRRHETGRLDGRGFYEAFCEAVGRWPDFDAMVEAATDIFELNWPLLPLVAHLAQSGCPMGILSNTGETHWNHCLGRYRIIGEGFSVHAASYRIGAMKPDGAVYCAAAEMAGYSPEDIFFVDDRPEHVAGARAAGFDAVQFTTAAALAEELRERGVRFNY
ncbi:MAG: HAD family phosphatase [Pirellulales bacterium]|nr:HAD family phosphatase [Pirellulales bacterium]